MSRYISLEQQSEILPRRSSSFKDLIVSHFNKLDLKGLLELLNVTNDVDLLHKVFSALSVNLMFNKGANIDVIVKCTAVYDKIQNVVSKGIPQKSAEALNFLSALLYIDAEESGSTTKKRTLALHACNMTRTSGCLSLMCELFVNCMMYHDTWKALCQCLAVACINCEINQSYCSHLIPVCIEKCGQANMDALLVLQSLLLNHYRNIQLFLNCNGVLIFSRDLLQYDKCLQLLTTVAQCTAASALLLRTNVPADLRDFLRLYGPDSQLGQKAIIILNHISSCTKVVTEKDIRQNSIATETKINTKLSESDLPDNAENELDETKVLIQNVMKEIFKSKQRELQNFNKNNCQSVGESSLVEQTFSKYKPQMHDNGTIERNKIMDNIKTKKLHCDAPNEPPFMYFQNKIQTTKQKYKKPERLQNNHTSQIHYKNKRRTNERKRLMDNTPKNLHSDMLHQVSFSFLQNHDFQVPKQIYKPDRLQNINTSRLNYMHTNGIKSKGAKENKTDLSTRTKEIHCDYDARSELSFTFLQNKDFQASILKEKQPIRLQSNKTQFINIDDMQKNDTDLYKTISRSKSNIATMTLEDFKPIYASTPKHKASVSHTEATGNSYKTVETQTKLNRYKTLKMKRRNAKKVLPTEKVIKNRSLGAKFFRVINDSCTTFVKTVKNIFNKKSSTNNSATSSSTISEKTIDRNKRSNTYSFINYMKKRDALLNSHWMKSKMIDRSDFSTATNYCNTCNNTEVLKHKLTKDEFLKLTVKKLKMGINLYGCDFKKISKAMWPRDSYMTPLVLYNLYRKLLMK